MDREARKQELVDFLNEYVALCMKYECAIDNCGYGHMVDFTAIRALDDYREGEIEEGLDGQIVTLTNTIDECVDSDNYQSLDDDDEE